MLVKFEKYKKGVAVTGQCLFNVPDVTLFP